MNIGLRRAGLVAAACFALVLQGCATAPTRLSAVPSELTARAEIPGMPGVRYVGGGDMGELIKAAFAGLRVEQEELAKKGHRGPLPPASYLAVSGGKRYQEMHVDGGTMAQVFAYPTSMRIDDLARTVGVQRQRHLYIIRNARLDPDWAHVERSTMSIAGRAVASLIHTQGIGDLYRIFGTAQRDHVDFNLTFIPSTFNHPHPEEFDNAYMRALYDVGYNAAAKGMRWAKTPPGYQAPEK